MRGCYVGIGKAPIPAITIAIQAPMTIGGPYGSSVFIFAAPRAIIPSAMTPPINAVAKTAHPRVPQETKAANRPS